MPAHFPHIVHLKMACPQKYVLYVQASGHSMQTDIARKLDVYAFSNGLIVHLRASLTGRNQHKRLNAGGDLFRNTLESRSL
jgi:hypothetical protein